MAFAIPILISIAVSTALSFGIKLIASLFNQQSNQPQYGGQLQKAADPGTQLTVRRSDAPQNAVFGTRRVPGKIVFAHCTDNNSLLNLVVAWAGHEVDGYDGLYIGDELVPLSASVATGRYAGYLGCVDYLGTDDQPADANLIERTGGRWTSAHRGLGIAYSYLTLTWNRDLYGQFDIGSLWRVVRGMKVLDPRDDTTAYSENPALVVAAWLNSNKFGRGMPYAEMIEDDLIASANACDEEVAKADGTTEPRYTCNALLLSDEPFVDNVNKLLSSMHGELMQVGDKWSILAGVWEEPELVFDEGDLLEPISVQNGVGRDGFNAIKGKFADPAQNWQSTDFPAIVSAAYEIEDGGDGAGSGRVFQDVNLECTNSASMAQRIARIDLRQARQPIAFTAKLKLKALRARVGKNVKLSFAMLGWTEKAFRVRRLRYIPGFGPDGTTPGIVGVELDLRETGSFIFDWSASDEIAADPIPDTTLPSTVPLPPSNLRIAEQLYWTRPGGGVKAKVVFAWDASPDAFVRDGGWYIAEYKLSSESAWTKLPRVDAGATSVDILDIDPGTYDFRCRSYQWTGASSQTIPSLVEQPIAGVGAAPSAPTGFTLVRNGNFVAARWDPPPDLDVEIGGSIVFKHASQLTAATWADGRTISKPLPAALTKAELPLVAGTYMAKYVDAGGVWSTNFASYATAQSGQLEFAGLVGGSLVEDPAFAGTKSGCVALGGVLKLGGAGLFSAIPLVSAVPSVAYYGGVGTAGTYTWSQPIDLGVKTHCRVTVNMTSLSVNVFDLVSQRTGNVSTWPRFGGSVAGIETDVHTEVRFTDDDPNGVSPSWSSWARLDVGEFDARGFQFRSLLESGDDSFDRQVSALAAVAEEVV